MEDHNFDIKIALEEMRFNMERSLSDGDTIDQKMNLVLGASGLVMTIGTSLQITLTTTRSELYWIILTVLIILYIIAVGIVLWGAGPKRYHLAIASEWEEIDKQIFGRSEREAILSLLAGYVDQIQHNRKINYRKVQLFRASLIILFIVVILLIVLVYIPRRGHTLDKRITMSTCLDQMPKPKQEVKPEPKPPPKTPTPKPETPKPEEAVKSTRNLENKQNSEK